MTIDKTEHRIIIDAAQKMFHLDNESVDLVVTSPPYPMISMWDDILANQNEEVGKALKENDGARAFEYMHLELDKVWEELERVVQPGGIVCINIGDATRTVNGKFSLYSNHTRIIQKFLSLGMNNLPNIIWRKQTNAPNKFMGSGMLPTGAYVTLEHEWILVFRKGAKRNFNSPAEKLLRQRSSYFWEERNIWFSDLWDLKGTKQKISVPKTRERSAAYPFELPYRLINMYSVYGDTVLDPFLGTGTTSLAAIASGRNSVGYEIDQAFERVIIEGIVNENSNYLNKYIQNRIDNHTSFVTERKEDGSKSNFKHFNEYLNIEVMTSQEKNIILNFVEKIYEKDGVISAEYSQEAPFEIDFKKELNLFQVVS